MNTLTYTMALAMGFLGSLHCIGMCGAIVLVMPFQHLTGIKRGTGIFIYHLGRVSIYALLAALLFSFRSLFHPQIQQYISMILGALLLVAGLVSFFPGSKIKISLPWTEYVKRKIGDFILRPGLSTLFIMGLLNGLLPCGLVYMALSAAITTADANHAIGFMYLFGIGTSPALVSITLLKRRLSFLNINKLKKTVPVFIFVFGLVLVLRGMDLGIPYLSPKITMTQHTVKASCCHKK